MSINADASPNSVSELQGKNVAKNLIAGGLARMSAATLLSPIDVIKTRLQFQRKHLHGVVQYNGITDAFRTILRTEGVTAFYKGLPVRLLYIAPSAAVSFTVYEQFKIAWKSHDNHDSISTWTGPLITLAAGGCARVFGTAARTPFDIIKQQVQVEGLASSTNTSTSNTTKRRGIIPSIVSTVREIGKSEGARGFFTGYGVTLMRDAPFAALYFLSYETLKYVQSEYVDTGLPRFVKHLIAGGSAGVIATTCTIPLDVVKTRLQTQARLPAEAKRYAGVVDALRTIWHEEGIRGLTRGLGPRVAYIIPASSLTFAAYEKFKSLLSL